MKQNVALIGLGKYAKYLYLPYMKQENVHLSFVVDLESKKDEVMSYLKNHGFEEVRFFGISKSSLNAKHLDKEFATQLKAICSLLEITHFIVSTEIKAHYRYIEFALKNKIPTLCDKTLVTSNKNPNRIHTFTTTREYKVLQRIERKTGTNCYFLNEIEYNPIYDYAKKVLKKFMNQYHIPITYIDIYECDGEWKMPHEFCKKSFPGKLFQNGYSYIYLLSSFLAMNQELPHYKKIVHGSLHSDKLTLKDEISCITKEDYKQIFDGQNIPDEYYMKKKFKVKGNCEDNFYSTLNFRNKKNQTVTHANINLLHFGLSNRQNMDSEIDYKRNMQEKIHIQLGTLLDMKIISFINDEGKEEMELTIAYNQALLEKKEIEVINSKDIYQNDEDYIVEKPVKEYLSRFLNKDELNGNLKDHAFAMELLRSSVKSMQSRLRKTRKIKIPTLEQELTIENLRVYSNKTNIDEDKKILHTKIRKMDENVCGVVLNRLKEKKGYEVYYYFDDGKDVASELCYRYTKLKWRAEWIYFYYSKIANPKRKLNRLLKK
ncbi:MAG: hypothetical protein IJ704_02785 [Bacilli bacterium]|nr:hypothetical protein [Bacilli bacterium]